MRRIARELDVGTMGLYRYVPEKAVLLDLMLNYVWAESAHARGDESHRTWRDVLETDARSSRDMHLEHPWLLQINSIRPVLGPGAVTSMELAMSGLKELPFTDREKIILISALDAYVTGSVRQEIMYSQAAEESGISDEEFWESSLPYMERAMASGDYPTMATMDDDCFDAGWSETFEYGLKRLLDGVEADLATSHSD